MTVCIDCWLSSHPFFSSRKNLNCPAHPSPNHSQALRSGSGVSLKPKLGLVSFLCFKSCNHSVFLYTLQLLKAFPEALVPSTHLQEKRHIHHSRNSPVLPLPSQDADGLIGLHDGISTWAHVYLSLWAISVFYSQDKLPRPWEGHLPFHGCRTAFSSTAICAVWAQLTNPPYNVLFLIRDPKEHSCLPQYKFFITLVLVHILLQLWCFQVSSSWTSFWFCIVIFIISSRGLGEQRNNFSFP